MTLTAIRSPSTTTSSKLWCWAIMPPTSRLEFPDECRRIKLAGLNGATIGMAIATQQYSDGRRWFRFHISNTSDGREAVELIRTSVLDAADPYTIRGRRLSSINLVANEGPIDIGPDEQTINRRNAIRRLAKLSH